MNLTTIKPIATTLFFGATVVATCVTIEAQSPATFRGHTIDPEVAFAQNQAIAGYGPDIHIEFGDDQVPNVLSGRLFARTHSDDPTADAKAAVALYAAAFRVGPDDGFWSRETKTSDTGMISVRMAQTYKHIPVAAGELVVEMSQDQVTTIRGRFIPDLLVDTSQEMTTSEIASSAVRYAFQQGLQNPQAIETRERTIVRDSEGIGHLAVPVHVHGTNPGPDDLDLLTDADTGRVLAAKAVTLAISTAPKNALLNPSFAIETVTPPPQCNESGPWYTFVNGETSWNTNSANWSNLPPPSWPQGPWWSGCVSMFDGRGMATLGTTSTPWIEGIQWWPNWPATTELWQSVTVPPGTTWATLNFDLGILADQSSSPLEQLVVSILCRGTMIPHSTSSSDDCPAYTNQDYALGQQMYSNMSPPYAYTYARQVGNLVEPPAPIITHATIPLTVNVSNLAGHSIRVDFKTSQGPGNDAFFWITKPSLIFTTARP